MIINLNQNVDLFNNNGDFLNQMLSSKAPLFKFSTFKLTPSTPFSQITAAAYQFNCDISFNFYHSIDIYIQ